MDQKDEIRSRIEGKKKTNFILKFFQGVFVLASLVMGFLIYARNDEEATFLNRIFNVNISFHDMNQDINLFLSKIFSSFNIFTSSSEDILQVNNSIKYISDGNNYFHCESNDIKTLLYGQIVNINEDEKGYNVTIYYKGNITAVYYELESISVRKGDLLNSGQILGTYEDTFKVLFEKNGSLISYEDVILS